MRARLAIVGIGNPLARDDGVGPEVVRRLRERLPEHSDVLLHTLEGDLLEIADHLDRAERFILVDAVAGESPGRIVIGQPAERAWAPSFHQTDIATVMRALAAMGVADPFPAWELWGVTIRPPTELGEGLSPQVEAAAEALVERLLGAALGASPAPTAASRTTRRPAGRARPRRRRAPRGRARAGTG
jgi:hydrogenase maturation protease